VLEIAAQRGFLLDFGDFFREVSMEDDLRFLAPSGNTLPFASSGICMSSIAIACDPRPKSTDASFGKTGSGKPNIRNSEG
jgi:hypothetical protein